LDLEGRMKEARGQAGFALETLEEVTASTAGAGVPAATYKSIASLSRTNRPRSSMASETSGSTKRRKQRQRATFTAHVVCAISENLAKETCVASLDAGAPVALQVTKQGNGQTYAETLAYLELLSPDEVLLNEGRRNSQLARKVLELYSIPLESSETTEGFVVDSNHQSGAGTPTTVVKFISRACFDQTKGEEMLTRVAREDTYDAAVMCEYILLSSAHAVLNYTQQNLGASFSRKSVQLMVNSGGSNKMVIDRSTLLQLELLANAKSGKTKGSLISTIDHTQTSVGSRLLRTSLMSPSTRVDTINSRLDLVDAFLADEEFLLAVGEQLRNLPCLDKMLSNVALVPRKTTKKEVSRRDGGTDFTKRIARKGISALLGIKTALSALPGFVTVLEGRLNEIESHHRNEVGQNHQHQLQDEASTLKSSLLLGLGGGPPTFSELLNNQLLRAIILAMRNPALTTLLDEVAATVSSSTTSTNRNAQSLRHEECFALKVTDPMCMMKLVRDAFTTNVNEIYQRADEYAETHGFYVSVR
jgi:DNA mismatch repair ATPase MutS